jgi:hypothetical protein
VVVVVVVVKVAVDAAVAKTMVVSDTVGRRAERTDSRA